ncbi:MAG: hypothetical protein ABI193_10695 [Minicystis sp.]
MFDRSIAAFLLLSSLAGCAGALGPENVAELPDEREGELCATPAALDFGKVRVGEVVNGVMRLRNDGAAPIDIRSVVVSPAAPLRAWLSSPSVDPGTGALLDISFTPRAASAHKAMVVITYRSSGASGEQVLSVPVSGQGG